MIPLKFEHLPLGVIRATLSGDRIVLLIDSTLPIVHSEFNKIKNIDTTQTAKRYWIVAIDKNALDNTNSIFTITNSKLGNVKLQGKDTYTDAENQFISYSTIHANKTPKTGFNFIGKED